MCISEITAHFTVNDMIHKGCNIVADPWCNGDEGNHTGINLMYAGGHCHAPSCVSIELYNADTGELIC